MRVISPKVELINTKSILETVERVGRVSYKSEDKIIDNLSAGTFVTRMENSGHWSVLEFGTLYYVIPEGKCVKFINTITNPYRSESRGSRLVKKDGLCYVTTNLRAFNQFKYEAIDKKDMDQLEEVMTLEKYRELPDPSVHKLRVTSHWISSIAVSNQAMRSRVFSQLQESQRYCNYSKGKFGSELTFIIPYWAYEKEFNSLPVEAKGQVLNSISTSNEDWGTTMWEELKKVSKKCRRRDDYWKSVELEYMEEIKDGMLPEEARDVLDKQVKTEFYLCGFLDDWFYTPPEESPEKAGFFSLRTAQSAQGDIRNLAISLKEQMINEYDGPYFNYQITK